MTEPSNQEQDLESLRAKLLAAEKARDEYLDLAKQGRAEFENYQKRFQRDLALERLYAQKPLAADLLPALDNLDRALAAAKQAGDAGPLAQGVSLVQSQLLDALKRHGVARLESAGQPFDANRHEAVMQQPSAEHPAGTVLQVLEEGYTIHDRVLRPARVLVSVQA
ncbi:MAG: nucleotide exchange factor GrpE [Gemmataceae bacterium]|nr:nucleotide exchange factor GrpE [Gemmataceae bacterium]